MINNNKLPQKSFWSKPEGKPGMVILAGIIVGGGILLYKTLPFLIKLAENTIYLTGLIILLTGIIYILVDPRFRNLLWFAYKSIMRALTGLFIQLDPISIIESYLQELKKQCENIYTQLGNVRGQIQNIETQISTNDKEIEKCLTLADKANRENIQDQKIIQTRQAARLKESNNTYGKLLIKLKALYTVLNKMYSGCSIMVDDLSHDVELKKKERKTIRASYNAMKSASLIIRGGDDKRSIFDQTMESMTEDVSMKLGEINHFIEVSGSIIDKIDLENGLYEENGLKMLEEWTIQSMPKIFNTQTTNNNTNAVVTMPPASTSKYQELFNN